MLNNIRRYFDYVFWRVYIFFLKKGKDTLPYTVTTMFFGLPISIWVYLSGYIPHWIVEIMKGNIGIGKLMMLPLCLLSSIPF
jgi:hypothetical protein